MSSFRFPKPAAPRSSRRAGDTDRRHEKNEDDSRRSPDADARRSRDADWRPRSDAPDGASRRSHNDDALHHPREGGHHRPHGDAKRRSSDEDAHRSPGDDKRRAHDAPRHGRGGNRSDGGDARRTRYGRDSGRGDAPWERKRDDVPRYGREDSPRSGRDEQRSGDYQGPRGDSPARGRFPRPEGGRPFAGGNRPYKPTRKFADEPRRAKPDVEDFDAIDVTAGNFSRAAAPARISVGIPEQEAPVFLPGAKPVLELLESAPQRIDSVFLRKGRHTSDMERIVDACRVAKVRFSLLESTAYSKLYSGKSQGVLARLFEAGFTDFDELLDKVMDSPMPLLLALDQVQDPGNAGTLARTLYALGGVGMVVPRHNGAYLGAGAAKAAAGALEKLPVAKVANLGQALDAAKARGITVYGAAGAPSSATEDPDVKTAREIPMQDIFSIVPRVPAVLVLGGEEGGLRPSMEKRCDMLVRIPMLRDFDSLNVAQAGAIILGWFSKYCGK